MIDNATYSLIETTAQISQGLRRNSHERDAEHCQTWRGIWNLTKQADEELLDRLVGHIRQHFAVEGCETTQAA